MPRHVTVYLDLKRRLLLGEYAAGTRMVSERLAAEFGVSRTPVREALLSLQAEGLLEQHPEGGLRPVVPRLESIPQLYELRMILEVAALQRPGNHGGRHHDRALEELAAEWRALRADPPEPHPDLVLLDESFHVGLARAAGNTVLADQLAQVNERIRLVRIHDFMTADRVQDTINEHLGIAEAVLAADIELAVRRFRDHLRISLQVAEERALRALARMTVSEAPRRPMGIGR